jgi:hypothetical protein
MNTTSVSLLERLKAARPDASDWRRLQGIYLPLICRWINPVPGIGGEADDLGQEVSARVTVHAGGRGVVLGNPAWPSLPHTVG